MRSPRGRPWLLPAVAAIVSLWGLSAGIAGQEPLPKGPVALGSKLFSGSVRFENGGPPCAACHAVATLPFPNGGTLGPDLTGTFAKFGPAALGPVLATLPFPAMVPIFHDRPLSSGEQADLAAFFEAAATGPAPPSLSLVLVLVSCAACAALLVLAGILWRHRLTGVRRSLLREMRRPRGRPA